MTDMYGANSEELRRLAGLFSNAATSLETIDRQTNVALHNSPWSGADAELHRRDWSSSSRPALAAAVAFLRDASRLLDAHAGEQERASGAASFSESLVGPHSSSSGSEGDWTDEDLDFFQFLFGQGSNAWSVLSDFSRLKNLSVAAGLFEYVPDIGPLSFLGAVSWGVDVVQFVDDFSDQSAFDNGRDLVGLLIDGAGIALPQVGLAKGAWDLGWWVGSTSAGWIDDQFDTSGAFVASTVARTGKVPDYEGADGFFRYVGDGVLNALSPKAWGF